MQTLSGSGGLWPRLFVGTEIHTPARPTKASGYKGMSWQYRDKAISQSDSLTVEQDGGR